MRAILSLILIGLLGLSMGVKAEDFPRLAQVQLALDNAEIGLLDRNGVKDFTPDILSFERLRYFVLTNDQALRVNSREFAFLPAFEQLVSKMSSGFGTMLRTLDYAESRLVEERADVALEAFEIIRFYALTDQEVLSAENNAQFQGRIRDLQKSVDSGQLRTLLETPDLSFSLIAHLRGEQTEKPRGNVPWPFCKIWRICSD